MKKLVCLALALSMLIAPAAFANAQAAPEALFGYIIDLNGNTMELMTDNDTLYAFTRDEGTQVVSDSGEVRVDDAVVLKYEGALNQSAEQQSVKVAEIDVLNVMYGIITDATMNTVTVLSDDDGLSYTFATEDADIVVGEDGILLNDQIELAFPGPLPTPGDANAFVPSYLHITVYGQVEGEIE